MAQQRIRGKPQTIPPAELLTHLEKLELEKTQPLSEQLQDSAIETQLLALSGFLIEQEIEQFRNMLALLRKQSGK